jgi:hypothetical protein
MHAAFYEATSAPYFILVAYADAGLERDSAVEENKSAYN